MNNKRKKLYSDLDNHYNINLTLQENLDHLRDLGFNLSKSSLYNYTISRDLDTLNYLKNKRKNVLEIYDPERSMNDNLIQVKKKGINISISTLYRYVRESKEDV